MNNPRLCALEALKRTRKDGAYSNLVLDVVLSESDLSSADRAFASALYYGVLERTITLDYIISQLCTSSAKKVAPLVMDCLRLGIYQIKYMDKVPESAAVNETVKIAKQKCSGAAGFVNAVLRRACREEIELPVGRTAYALSINYSCHKSIAKELMDSYGYEQAEKFLAESLNAPPVYIRVNTTAVSPEVLMEKLLGMGLNVSRTDIPEALAVKNIGNLENNPLFTEGFFHVEDMAAQWAVKVLAPKAGQRVLDLCAAPGGKAFSAAEYMENKGEILAFDLYENRANLIRNGAERLGLSIVRANAADSTVHNSELGQFDRVLCDVPCSGLGIIRRKPDIKYKSAEDFADLPDLQYALLENGAKYLKKGGRLVYSTCTLRPAENENIVARFLAEHPEFSPLELDIAGERASARTFWPQSDKTDGFFVAVFVKE